MVGRAVDKEYYRERRQKPFDAAKVLMELEDVRCRAACRISPSRLHAGEVLCLVGAEGSGREAIVRAIYGMITPDRRHREDQGQDRCRRFHPAHAAEAGVGYVPRERKVEGIVSGMNVYENMTLSQQSHYSHGGRSRHRAEEKALARDWITQTLDQGQSSEYADCGNLSGGNQQKVVLAKVAFWRLRHHAARPSRRAASTSAPRKTSTKWSATCRDAGVGILLVADTFEEAIGLSHTIIVVKDGSIQKRFDTTPAASPLPSTCCITWLRSRRS